jgi:imidazolonepropionase
MSEKPRATLLITHAAELLTCVAAGNDPIGRIRDGAIAINGERIVALGTTAQVEQQLDTSGAHIIDARDKIVAPGFVDCHTHLIFGGSRVQEYAARMTHTPEQVRAMGIPVGIGASVAMTRSATGESLYHSAAGRVRRMFRCGTTTVESKSGYGLTLADELKMLEVNRRLRAELPVDIVSTFLGAHAFPDDLPREQYISLIVEEMIPRVAEQQLAEFCDVFCDEGYFTAAESRRILVAGRKAGMQSKIHTDQYSAIEGSRMAVELGIISADHLNYTDRATMRRFAEAGITGVVTPVLDFAVRHPHPFDARAMLGEGMRLALATDFCPGCWVESMQVVMQFACRLYQLSPEEALLAATVGAAHALGLGDRGTLAVGQLADLQIWDVPTFEDVIYRIGNNAVQTVLKRGKPYHFHLIEENP